MPAGNSKVSGSLNGSVVNQPRPFSQIDGRVQALLDRGPDREGRAELIAVDNEVGAVPDADLVYGAEKLVSGVASEHVGESWLDADAGQRQQATLFPFRGELELLVAELDAGL